MRLYNKTFFLILIYDIFSIGICWILAFLLRFNFDIPPAFLISIKKSLVFVVLLQLIIFYVLDIYKIVWKYINLDDLIRIVISIILSSTLLGFFSLIVSDYLIIPRSVLFIYPSIILILTLGSRLIQRIFFEQVNLNFDEMSSEMSRPIILLGLDDNSVHLIKMLKKNKNFKLIGILDNNSKIHNLKISGIPILGSFDSLIDIANKFDIKHAILAKSDLNDRESISIINAGKKSGIEISKIPNIKDFTSKNAFHSRIESIEIEDLLGRHTVKLNQKGIKEVIESQTILVTGAAGSIGSQLCQQILKFKPKLLICVDISEFGLYALSNIIEKQYKYNKTLYLVVDVKNNTDIERLLSKYTPNIVFHTAAYKHVPLMENNNVSQAIFNNAIGTYTIAKACANKKIKHFVLVSTDKAVNPTNIMGASKRLAEILVQSLQKKYGTNFTIVRFGNVLGSSGSVIPKFRDQIAAGGPVTITHAKVTRYFMSIYEAAQLILQAATIGKGGEIFILDMGEPIKILELAKMMIKLSGFNENEIKIKYSGLRPGEKLYEELLANNETTKKTAHNKIRIVHSERKNEAWIADLLKWISSLPYKKEVQIKKELKKWVNEYKVDKRHYKSIY